MKITLLVTGTLGDVRPNLALTLGLQELGHQVTLVAPEILAENGLKNDLDWVEKHLPTAPVYKN
jgi:UDP:flavonoid glycosyltransferase YjiC (YdhE family)